MIERFIEKAYEKLFGCPHFNYTFPMQHPFFLGNYVCCTNCGKEFAYDFVKMQVIGPCPEVLPIRNKRTELQCADRHMAEIKELEAMYARSVC